MENQTLIFIDAETTGLNPKLHNLLTLALMVVKDNKLVAKKEWKIKHLTYHVTEEALKVNGIDINEHDKVAQDKELVGREIIKFLNQHCNPEKRAMLVGQNTIFDKNFLETFLAGLNNERLTAYNKLVTHRYIDLMSITAFLNLAGVIKTEGIGLDAIIKHFDIPVKARHTALDDARMTIEGLYKMIQLLNPNVLYSDGK